MSLSIMRMRVVRVDSLCCIHINTALVQRTREGYDARVVAKELRHSHGRGTTEGWDAATEGGGGGGGVGDGGGGRRAATQVG